MEFYIKCKVDKQKRFSYKSFLGKNQPFVFGFDPDYPGMVSVRKMTMELDVPEFLIHLSDDKGRITIPSRLLPKGTKEVWITFKDKNCMLLEFH